MSGAEGSGSEPGGEGSGSEPGGAVSGSDPGGAGTGPGAPDAASVAGERPIRRYHAAVSVGAMALGWANLEKAPSGATVVVAHEVSPLGRLGQMWPVEAASTLAFAVVLRPALSAEEADVPWLVAALAVADGLEAAGGPAVQAAWPDSVVAAGDGTTLAGIRADVQLGPGKVRAAVASVRIDLSKLSNLGDGPDEERRERLLTAICDQLDQRTAELADGVAGPLAAYEKRCGTLGRNLKLHLLPRGEMRAHASAIDPLGRLELRSATGMVERVSVNQIRGVEVLG